MYIPGMVTGVGHAQAVWGYWRQMSMIDPVEDKRSGRSQRMRRLVRLTMDCSRRKGLAITLRNISPKGFGASCQDLAMMVGETVHLQIKGKAAVEGEIRWVDGHKFGPS